jgi:hypothetical protein
VGLLRPPFDWNRLGPVVRACELAVDGAGRVGVVTEVHGLARLIHKGAVNNPGLAESMANFTSDGMMLGI